MPTITDTEFGEITVRRSARSRSIRIRVAPNGLLQASLPPYAPLFMLKRLLNSSRDELRGMIGSQTPSYTFEHGMKIGKSHTLIVQTVSHESLSVTRHGQSIIVTLPDSLSLEHTDVQQAIRDSMIKALRIEAKSYLPKRLAYLAEAYGYQYDRVRFSHASGRWGSCSTSGTISLNIALMKLPHELIDYVLIHELSHTKQMNHSRDFWRLVEQGDPHYTLHRRMLKQHTPHI